MNVQTSLGENVKVKDEVKKDVEDSPAQSEVYHVLSMPQLIVRTPQVAFVGVTHVSSCIAHMHILQPCKCLVVSTCLNLEIARRTLPKVLAHVPSSASTRDQPHHTARDANTTGLLLTRTHEYAYPQLGLSFTYLVFSTSHCPKRWPRRCETC